MGWHDTVQAAHSLVPRERVKIMEPPSIGLRLNYTQCAAPHFAYFIRIRIAARLRTHTHTHSYPRARTIKDSATWLITRALSRLSVSAVNGGRTSNKVTIIATTSLHAAAIPRRVFRRTRRANTPHARRSMGSLYRPAMKFKYFHVYGRRSYYNSSVVI